MDGIDLSGRRVGDVVQLNKREADLLIAEGWATPVFIERRGGHDRRGAPVKPAPRYRG